MINKLKEYLLIDFSKYVVLPNNKLIEKSVYNYLINNESNFLKFFKQ